MNKLHALNEKMSHYRWTICSLLFFATTFSYLDRQVLSLLQPMLADEFNWTNSDYADITASFQFTYAIAMLFAGRFIDWIGTKRGYAWSLFIWSIGAIMHAYAITICESISPLLRAIGIILPFSVAGFMVSRIVLAIGEAGNFPAAIKTTAEWFPKKERSLATGIFNCGANVGAILAPLTVPWIAGHLGWEMAFVIIGSVGFIWIGFWIWLYKTPQMVLDRKGMSQSEFDYIISDQEAHEVEEAALVGPQEKVSWVKLLSYRQTYAFAFGKFMTDGVWWFFLFWLPAYLKAKYDIVGEGIIMPLTILYTITVVGSIGGGWFPSYFINKGMQVYKARMTAMLIIALFPLVVLAAQPLGDITYWIPVVLIGIGGAAHQAWSANIFTTVSDMFPKKAVASVTGIGGMAGAMGAVVITKVSGYLFDYFGALGHIETGYTYVFAFCAVAYVIAWGGMKLLVPKYSPITNL